MYETPDQPHKHHARGAPRWFDIVVTLTLVIISAVSLYTSMHSGDTMERLVSQNERLVRASSTPLLQFGHGNSATVEGSPDPISAITFSVENVGTGPARIVWFEVHHNGQPLTEFGDLITRASEGAGNVNWSTTTAGISGTMMRAGEDRRIAFWQRPPASDAESLSAWQAVDRARWNLKIEACFCSIFDECWISDLTVAAPKPTPACDPTGRVPFAG